eukprot:4169603-Amphidinium_carterae.1
MTPVPSTHLERAGARLANSSCLHIVVVGTFVIPSQTGCFHLALIAMGRSTREVVTGNYVDGQGLSFFAPRGPSLIRARAEVHER